MPQRTFAIDVEQYDGMWTVTVSDEQGGQIHAHGSTLPYAVLTAAGFISGHFTDEQEDTVVCRGGHP